MILKRKLLANELLKEIIRIRIDTLWKMLYLRSKGFLPGKYDEGATGDFDNKGAMFIPGGLIFTDSDKNAIIKEEYKRTSTTEFREKIREAMQYDNATLLYPGAISFGVNLDNGFFSAVASNIINYKYLALKRKKTFGSNPPLKINSDDISKSHAPLYMKAPYGARTKLSSCLAVCLIEPRMYYMQCRSEFSVSYHSEEIEVWNTIKTALSPVTGKSGVILAQPHIIVCHTTRYRETIFGGITRILGYGKIGEFSTLTFEKVNHDLVSELEQGKSRISETHYISDFNGIKIVCVLRSYYPTKPGKRLNKCDTQIIHLEKDLDIDVEKISAESRERYTIN
jgi:hypothetical protein